MGFFGSQQDTTEKTQTTTLPQKQEDLANLVFDQALSGYGQIPLDVYGGARVPDVPRPTVRSQNQRMDLAGQLRQGTTPQDIMNLASQTAQGHFLNPNSNPFLRQTINAAIRPVRNQFFEQALPGISSAAVSGGAYGGTDQQKVKERALRDFETAAMDTSSQLSFENLSRERALQQMAPQLYQQGISAALQPAQILSGVGQERYNQQLMDIAAQREKFAESQTAPFRGLDVLSQAVQLPAGGTVSSRQDTEAPSKASEFLKGALGAGLGAGSVFWPQQGQGQPQQGGNNLWATAAPIALSAIAGGVGSLF